MAATTGAANTGADKLNETESRLENDGLRLFPQDSSSEGEVSSGDAGEGPLGTAAPPDRARTAGKVSTVREYWCVRATRAYPGAEAAAKEMAGLLEEFWDGRPEVSGPPSEVRVMNKGDERFGTPAASGLVSVLRKKFDGWEAGSIERLRAKAWAVQASLDECLSVKAFGRASNHAKEINWILCAVEGYLEAGGNLSKDMKEVRVGYTVLRPHVARDNGGEWTGAVFGINLSLNELGSVVGWAEGRAKDKAWSLPQEFRMDGNGSGRVVSVSALPGAVGFCFKSADHITGSAMIFVEGPLEVSDFDIGDSDELPGLEILRCALGEELVVDVEPSARGLAARSVVRVRIKCAIRHEKTLRRKIKKLVRSSADVLKSLAYETSEGPIDVTFHSAHSLRRLEATEMSGGGQGFRGRMAAVDLEELRRKDAMLEELQAHQVKSAAALDRVIDQVEKLAVGQAQAQELAKQVHSSLAAEQSRALNTVNMLAGIFTSYMEKERGAPVRLCNGGGTSSATGLHTTRWDTCSSLVATEVGGSGGHAHSPPPCSLAQRRVRDGRRRDGGGGGDAGIAQPFSVDREGALPEGRSCLDEEVEDSSIDADRLSPKYQPGREAMGTKERGASVRSIPAKISPNVCAWCGCNDVKRQWGGGASSACASGVRGGGSQGVNSRRWSRYGDGRSRYDASNKVRLRYSLFEGAAFNASLRWQLSPRRCWVRIVATGRGKDEGNGRGGADKNGGFSDSQSKRIFNAIKHKAQVRCGRRAFKAYADTMERRAETGPYNLRCQGGDENGHGKVVSQCRRRWRWFGLEDARKGCALGARGRKDANGSARARGRCRQQFGGNMVAMAPKAKSIFQGRYTTEQETVQGQVAVELAKPGASEAGGGQQRRRGAARGKAVGGEGCEGAACITVHWHDSMRGGQTSISPSRRAASSCSKGWQPSLWRPCSRSQGISGFGGGSIGNTVAAVIGRSVGEAIGAVMGTPVDERGTQSHWWPQGDDDEEDRGLALDVGESGRWDSVGVHGERSRPYVDSQSRVGGCSPQIRRRGSSGCRKTDSAGLGVPYGCSFRVCSSNKERLERGVGCGGAWLDGAGGARAGGGGSCSSHVAQAAQGRLMCGREARLCFAAVWDRHVCSGSGDGVWRKMGISIGGRGECRGGEGFTRRLAREGARGVLQCCEPGHRRGAEETKRSDRHHDDKLKMCSLVCSKYSAYRLIAQTGSAGKSIRGKPGIVGSCSRRRSEDDSAGVRDGHAQTLPEGTLGQTATMCEQPAGMELDYSPAMPTRRLGGVDAASSNVGGGSQETTLKREESGRCDQDDTRHEEGMAGATGPEEQAGWARRLRLRGGGPKYGLAGGGALAGARALTGAGDHREEVVDGIAGKKRSDADGRAAGETHLGRMLFWNARQLYVPLTTARGRVSEETRMASRKLEFLEHQIDWHDPWLVALLEVAGDVTRMRHLRQWFRRRGFPNMAFSIGEGSSRSPEGDEACQGNCTNGMVIALHKDFTLVSHKRLAFRTMAVTLLHKPSQRRMAVVCMHGASSEYAAGPEDEGSKTDLKQSFAEQLDAATVWCEEHHGALVMDANRVPCRAWRNPAASGWTSGDRELQRLVGQRCGCCSRRWKGGRGAVAEMIGEQTTSSGEPVWTRWGRSCDGVTQRSRLDVGVAFGDAADVWVGSEVVQPRWAAGSFDGWVSDHAMIVYQLRLRTLVCKGEARPLPVRMGSRDEGTSGLKGLKSPWVQMKEMTSRSCFLEELNEARRKAAQCGGSQIHALVPLVRLAGVEAVRRAGTAAQSKDPTDTGSVQRRFDDKSEVASWGRRLRAAQDCVRGRRSLDVETRQLIFHRKSGLKRWCPWPGETGLGERAWRAVIRRCRHQLRRAEANLRRRRLAEDGWLARKCKQIEESTRGGELTAHVRTIWRLIKKQGGEAGAINILHRGDKKGEPTLDVEDPEFLAEAGRIGEAFVDSMDKGSIPNAFTAWLRVFCTRHDELRGVGGPWSLRKEYSYELFERVLESMQGKAVGAGGLSVELLIAAASEVRWAFYNAMMEDLEGGHIAPTWRKVIYVLLRKPPPNDAALVSQRREIALMPQDLKILLQGVRILAYEKLSGRLEAAQSGWRRGIGCADPGVAVACVLDQARRLQHQAWVLYIDLANFFPAINRAIACECESFMGLPEEVTHIMAQIYGGQRGEPAHVSCQYETAIGLGAPFANRMGRLMGCPVSPDSAKILLDSVIKAIQISVKGVKLWPFCGEEICQLAYADDWVGTFDDVVQLKKALSIWLAWAEVVGARLGIKGVVKTVVTGVAYKDGKAFTPADPKLTDLDGTAIPLLPCDGLYKHLGVPRAANADAHLSWVGSGGVAGIRDKLRAGLRRIGRLKPGHTSPEQFICISNVLLGGLGGFYLQSAVASDAELEQIEREWRRSFNRFTRRDPSSHAIALYTPSASWRRGRTHLVRTGMAAIFTSVGKLLADSAPSPARAAVRSAVALAMYSWGCRSEPNRWQWGHLKGALRQAVHRKGARFIGDAWLLACVSLEEHRDPRESKEIKAEQRRVNKWGRWRGWENGAVEDGGPLSPRASWFRGGSKSLFDTRENGGLGLAVRPLLQQAGILELSQLCGTPFARTEGAFRWQLDRMQVAASVRTKVTAAFWKQWESAVNTLKGRRIQPVDQENAATAALRRYPRGAWKRGRGDDGWSASLALELRRQRTTHAHVETVEAYVERFTKLRHLEGSHTAKEERCVTSKGTMVCHSLSGTESEAVVQWGDCERGDTPYSVDDGWMETARGWADAIQWRGSDGWPTWSQSGAEVVATLLDEMPPAPRLILQARLALGKEAKAVDKGRGEKLQGVRVACDVQYANWLGACALQARLKFTHAVSVDASEGLVEVSSDEEAHDEWGWRRRRTAAAVVTHEGESLGGCVAEDCVANSYVGELCALIAGLDSAPAGSRVMVVVDSTSPVKAWLRFRRQGDRARRQYNAAHLLASLEVSVSRHRLVYFLWQRSHCGSPVNEWADVVAERLRLRGTPPIQMEREDALAVSLWPARIQGALFAWAVAAGECAAHEGMLARLGVEDVRPSADDVDIGILWGEFGAAASLMRDDRLMVADAGHVVGRRERDEVRSAACPLGCGAQGGTWYHYAFQCRHRSLVEERRRWEKETLSNWDRFDSTRQHEQIKELAARLRSGAEENGDLTGQARARVRRLLCGFVCKGGVADCMRVGARTAIRDTVIGGIRLLCLATRLEDKTRADIERRIRENQLLRKIIKGWRRIVAEGGPCRVAALRQCRLIRLRVIQLRGERGGVGWGQTAECGSGWRWTLAAALAARAEVENCFGERGDDAIVMWYIQMRWWGRWARRKAMSHAVTWAGWTESAERVMDTIGRRRPGSFKFSLRWQTSGEGASRGCSNFEMARWGVDEGVNWAVEVIEVERRHAQSCRAFFRLGGYRHLRRVIVRTLRENEVRRWQGMKDRLRNFVTQGSCSGAPCVLTPEDQRVHVTIEQRPRERAGTREARRGWEAGRYADKRGKWSVERITRVRWCLEQGGYESLVTWAGPYESSWVRTRDLNLTLQETAQRVLNEQLRLQGEPCREIRTVGREGRKRKRTAVETEEVWMGRKRRSPRLVEREVSTEKLGRAIIPYMGHERECDHVKERMTKREARRVWDAHWVNGVEHVRVMWSSPDSASEAVIPVAWFTSSWWVTVPCELEESVCLSTFSADSC